MVQNALLAGLPVVVMCGVLSVLVVVKRLGFVGQGVSHSAFGGVGVATVLAVYLPVSLLPWADAIQFGVIVAFCIAAALGMAAVSRRRAVSEDTAIGLFLVGSMALGAILVHASGILAARAGRPPTAQSWESILFGSVLLATPDEVVTAWFIAAIVLFVTWWVRRPLLFWVFDEDSAPAFGVRAGLMKTVLMVLLAVAIVVAMKLAGVVLATALLVLPGATALRLSDKLWTTVGLSVGCGVAGLLGGLMLSVQMDWPTGPCVVAVLTLIFSVAAAARTVAAGRTRRTSPVATPAGTGA
jgi:ABC-type Mn2+/Zn2+ transport system permease subunit